MAGNIFTQVAMSKPGQSTFNLNHDVKFSMDMGKLVPVNLQEVLPGDSFRLSFANMIRFAPMISPVMHRVRVRTDYFFVPNRILWAGWEDFITGNLDASANPMATIALGQTQSDSAFQLNSLGDYLGYPTVPDDIQVDVMRFNALPLAAYWKIYDDYYRDQNLQIERFVPLEYDDNSPQYGADSTRATLAFRAWPHDYFTSALPFAQKGDVVQVPLTATQDIPVNLNVGALQNWVRSDLTQAATGSLAETLGHTKDPSTAEDIWLDPSGTYTVDVQGQAADINSLRRAIKLQEWLERNARGGTRYTESIMAHFGTRSSDARLQRPELIGSHLQNVTISEVLSTAQEVQSAPTDIPVGYMAGHGISVGGGKSMHYYAEEHGWIMGIISVLPDTAYQQGVPRHLSRVDPLDYAWPTFANLGEQEIKVKELYAGAADPDATFGYIQRYAEYKYCASRVAGEFRDNLSFWHMGRIFDNEPVLNSQFISADPTTRIFAVQSGDAAKLYCHTYNMVSVRRKLPYFGIPSI
ncbi:MAG: major capsid protein [Microvirus sp.]|nr:MAG: major capsid protein [Microvirus sp.]